MESIGAEEAMLLVQMIPISISAPALSSLNLDINECGGLAVFLMEDFMEVQMIYSDIH